MALRIAQERTMTEEREGEERKGERMREGEREEGAATGTKVRLVYCS
jgi:hypothetical protein